MSYPLSRWIGADSTFNEGVVGPEEKQKNHIGSIIARKHAGESLGPFNALATEWDQSVLAEQFFDPYKPAPESYQFLEEGLRVQIPQCQNITYRYSRSIKLRIAWYQNQEKILAISIVGNRPFLAVCQL